MKLERTLGVGVPQELVFRSRSASRAEIGGGFVLDSGVTGGVSGGINDEVEERDDDGEVWQEGNINGDGAIVRGTIFLFPLLHPS